MENIILIIFILLEQWPKVSAKKNSPLRIKSIWYSNKEHCNKIMILIKININ